MNKNSLIKKILIFLSIVYIVFGLGYLPSFIANIMHIKYFLSTPKDYWEDIIYDDFDFYTKGYSKSYKLNYKYFTLYSIQVFDENKKLPHKVNGTLYEFKGKIKVEYFSSNKLIKEDFIVKWLRGTYASVFKYMESYELLNFTIPIANQYKDLSIKLTVIEPMQYYSPENKLKLSIGATLKE